MGTAEKTGASRVGIAIAFTLAVACTLVHVGSIVLAGPGETTELIDWIYDATFLLAAAACFARALHSPEVRAIWIAFGIGLFAWGVGDTLWNQLYLDLRRPPYPSVADGLYLIGPIAFFVGVGLLIRRGAGRLDRGSAIDAVLGALAMATLGTAILAPALVNLDRGDTAAVLTNVAYPLVDLALVAMIGGGLILIRVREARSLLAIGLGMVIWAAADIDYLFLVATNAYEPGWIDVTWQLGALAIAGGALVTPAPARTAAPRRAPLVLPASFTVIAVTVLVWDHYERLRGVSVLLAAATLLLVAVRLGVSFRENDRLVSVLHDDSVTDPLTGLGNRRQLFDELGRITGEAGDGRSRVFALFDLDGFKAYNDAYGHPSGDALLRRLGRNLGQEVSPAGTAYRLGGDEFCVLATVGTRRPESIFESARSALREEGEGFSIGASGGWVLLPSAAVEAEEVMREVDRRMYEEKARRSPSAPRQTQDVLMRIFHEREPALGVHSEGVAEARSRAGPPAAAGRGIPGRARPRRGAPRRRQDRDTG